MSVLTNFLPVQELNEQEVSKQKDYIARLQKFREAVKLMSDILDDEIDVDSDIGRQILDREADVYQDFWDEVGFIPNEFKCSCLDTEEQYTYLSELSRYPVVRISELKKMADALSFVILPMDYINMDKIIKMYEEEDYQYATEISNSYEEFKEIVSACEEFAGSQQLYMLAPISFYDPWEEVSCEELLPKYFSKKLHNLSTILGIIMPTQRNLCKMINTSGGDLATLQETMQENFEFVKKSMEECHNRIDWVLNLTKDLKKRGRHSEKSNIMELELNSMTNLEYKLYCLLNSIIFSTDDEIDISDPNDDEAIAHIGLCFGTDMPIDFFVEKGMTIVNDKRFKYVTHVLEF